MAAGEHEASTGGNLPRSFIVNCERDRIVAAIADVMSITGYQEFTLEAVAERTGLPLAEVVGYFKDKEAAFIGAYETAMWQGLEPLMSRTLPATGFADAIWAGWDVFVSYVAAEPAIAYLTIVEAPGVVPAGLEHREQALKGFATIIAMVAEKTLPAGYVEPTDVYMAITLGGISEILSGYLMEGRIAELPDLVPDLAYGMMLPYLGNEAALAECERHRAASRS